MYGLCFYCCDIRGEGIIIDVFPKTRIDAVMYLVHEKHVIESWRLWGWRAEQRTYNIIFVTTSDTRSNNNKII